MTLPATTDLPRSFYLDPEGKSQTDMTLEDINHVIVDHDCRVWVDIDSSHPEQAEAFRQIAGLHPLSIEDALAKNSRPKVEEYADYLLIIIVGVRFHEGTPDPYDLETYDVSFLLGDHFLVTVHDGPSPAIDGVAERIAKSPDLLARGTDRLAHAIMDASVDAYFPLLDKIDDFVDTLEERVIVRFDESAMRDIFAVKRLILSLRRHIGPEREVFNVLTNRPSKLLSPESQIYFRDIYDHVLRINDSIDTYRELLSSVLDSYLTQISNRLGKITKGLSVIATISIPFVVLSGMWGMNFQDIPLATHPHAFWWMFVIQLAVGFVLLAILRFWKLI